MPSTPSILLFDVFGVIACHQSEAGKRELERAAKVSADRFWPAYWSLRGPHDAGQSATDYWTGVGQAAGVTYTAADIAALLEADIDSWSAVDEAMVAYVRQLAARRERLALLSNIPPELADRFIPRQSWLDVFEVRGFSCHIGHAKPDPAAFLWICEQLRCDPAEVLFIDDREENVRSAMALGMQGHVFESLPALSAVLDQRASVVSQSALSRQV